MEDIVPRALTIAFRGGLVALLAAVLHAAPGAAQQPQPQQDAPEVPEAELETFAEAYADIADIRQELQTELQAAETSEEANQIQQEADSRMQAVLEEHGISVQRYQEITQVLNSNPEQRQEFEQILAEIDGGGL